MPRRLLLDGDDLPALMQRVRTEMGPDAVVVKAERVRTGGLAGFFAKEHFEVTVEVPDARSARRPGPTAPRPGAVGLSALLEAADAADDGAGEASPAGPVGTHTGTAPAAPGREPGTPRVSTDGERFASLLASIDDMADVHPTAPAPGARTSAPRAARDDAGPEAPAGATPARPAARFAPQGATVTAATFAPLTPPAPPLRPADDDARTATGDGTAAEGTDVAAPGGAPAGSAAPARAAPDSAASESAAPDSAASARAAPDSAASARAAPDSAASVSAVSESAASESAASDSAAPGAAGPDRLGAAAAVARPALPAAPAAASPGASADASGDAPGGGDRRALRALGVPDALLGTGPLDEPVPLSRLVAALPRPPAPLRTAGEVLAVVAEGDAALGVAVQLAQRARLDSRDVVLAGVMSPVPGHGRRLLNPAAAGRHRAKASTSDTVSVVAVGVGPEPEDWSAAAELLAELAPDQAWSVLDARRKTSDLRAWLGGVAGAGRPFDVVAATHVHETREPGTVLDLGVPVGWLDGLPATPVVWAAVLSERLDAGARWY